jgi:hypothetical protein
LTSSKFGCTRPSPVRVACSVGVGRLSQTRAGLRFVKIFSVQPWSGIGHQRNILASTIHRVSPCFLLIWYFLIPEVDGKPPLTSLKKLTYFKCQDCTNLGRSDIPWYGTFITGKVFSPELRWDGFGWTRYIGWVLCSIVWTRWHKPKPKTMLSLPPW